MSRVLVTGGTGFVGANLVRRLIEEDEQVHLLVRDAYDDWRIRDIDDQISLHQVSLTDAEKLQGFVEKIRPQRIYHLAAHGAYSWQTNWQEMLSTNVQGTVNLIEACANVGFDAFVNAGSSSEYGIKDHPPGELEFPDPNSHYAATKLAATQYCRFLARSLSLPICTLRLYSVYGPYESPERFIPNLVVRGFDGKLPPLVHPAIARDYVFVDDVCDAFVAAASGASQKPGSVWNVGSGKQTSIKEIVELARTMLGIMEDPKFGTMPDRSWDTTVWIANAQQIEHDLGWVPKHNLEQGLSKTIAWFRKDDDMLNRYRKQLSVSSSKDV